jgi:hypothetical protein
MQKPLKIIKVDKNAAKKIQKAFNKGLKTIACGLVRDEMNGDCDCSYGAGFPCEDCIVNGGRKDPRK